MIDFDADAYMAAAAGPAAARDFFLERMVLGEGSRIRCAHPQRPTKLVRGSRLGWLLGLTRRIADGRGACISCSACKSARCLQRNTESKPCAGLRSPHMAQGPISLPVQTSFQAWCNLFDIERFKFLMEKLGLYRRIHGPQLLLRQHERQIQRRLRAAAAVALPIA